MSTTDELIADLEEASKPIDPVTGAVLENADPDSDSSPESEKTDGRKGGWSEDRKRRHSEKLKAAWQRRRENGTAAPKTRKRNTKATVSLITDQLTKGAAFIGGLWSLRDPYCGKVLIDRSDDLGRVYGKALGNNERIARFFDGMSKGGQYGELVLVTLSVLLPVLAHHDLLPRPMVNTVMRVFDPEFDPVPEPQQWQHSATVTDPVPNPYPNEGANGSIRSVG